MVIVTNNPESEPMLNVTKGNEEDEEPKEEFLKDHPRKYPLEEEAYRNITSSMMAEPLKIESVQTAMQLLTTAIQLQNMPLVNECIKNLDEHLNKDNVLTIYSHLSKCKMPTSNKNDFQPSAPPIIDNENQRGTDWLQERINHLRHNCLLTIDKEADYVLRRKELVDLSYVDIYSILSRDSLEVSCEGLVYIAVCNWGIAECNRMTLNTLHLQEVVRQLRYTPRYGLMSKKEFTSRNIGTNKGPTKSGILEEKDWRSIQFYITEKAKNRSVKELEHKMSTKRVKGSERPNLLSSKSSSRFDGLSSGKAGSSSNKERCEKCIINFLSCWTAIFD